MVGRLRANRKSLGLNLEALYGYLGLTRQGVYQALQARKEEEDLLKRLKEEVESYRRDKDRRAGSRSLYYNLKIKEHFGLGVTKFEGLMSRAGLTLQALRIRVVTTRSVYQSWNYENLINGLTINGINQVVVGDLTYVYVGRYCYYLFCLTDLYSARWVGLWVSDRMRAEDAAEALQAWINLRGQDEVKGCIHHSDGGSQYFSNLYQELIHAHGIEISVAKNCLENGWAEQRNGLLKHHLIPTGQIQSLESFRTELKRIDYFYNYQRKQQGLGWRTPVEYENHIEGLQADQRPLKGLHDFRAGSQKGQGFL